MLSLKGALFLALGGFGVFYALIWVQALRRKSHTAAWVPTLLQTVIGFVTNFFDTLGIGSFATTTFLHKQLRLVPDQLIPGTLNVGHTPPTILQAFIYISIVQVDMRTLVLMIAAAVAGSWLGAGFVATWPRRRIQVGMGIALLGAAGVILVRQLNPLPGGEALSLEGQRLAIGVAGNFLFGALMCLGIGLYAPCLILVSLLGMVPTAAFPIMMGSCAFLMPVASARFVRAGSFHPQASFGLALGGLPAVLIAATWVRWLPQRWVHMLVVVVVVYTATTMLWSAVVESRAVVPERAPAS